MSLNHPSQESTASEKSGLLNRLGEFAKKHRLLLGATLSIGALSSSCGEVPPVIQFKPGADVNVTYASADTTANKAPEITVCVQQNNNVAKNTRLFVACKSTNENGTIPFRFGIGDLEKGFLPGRAEVSFNLPSTSIEDGWSAKGCKDGVIFSDDVDKAIYSCDIEVVNNGISDLKNDVDNNSDAISGVADGVDNNSDAISGVADGVDNNSDAISDLQNSVDTANQNQQDTNNQVNEIVDMLSVEADFTVLDSNQNPVTGATIELSDPSVNQPIIATTSPDGTTTMSQLPANEILVFKISANGYNDQIIATGEKMPTGSQVNMTVVLNEAPTTGSMEWTSGLLASEGFTTQLTDNNGNLIFPVVDADTGESVTDETYSVADTGIARIEPDGSAITGENPGCTWAVADSPSYLAPVSTPVRVTDADGNPDSCQ